MLYWEAWWGWREFGIVPREVRSGAFLCIPIWTSLDESLKVGGMTLGEPAAVLEGLNYETLDLIFQTASKQNERLWPAGGSGLPALMSPLSALWLTYCGIQNEVYWIKNA